MTEEWNYINRFSKYKPCPKCNTRAFFKESDRTLTSATYTSTDTGQITERCKFCDYVDISTNTIAKLTPPAVVRVVLEARAVVVEEAGVVVVREVEEQAAVGEVDKIAQSVITLQLFSVHSFLIGLHIVCHRTTAFNIVQIRTVDQKQ